jgi:hypothetical protein
MTKPSKVGPDKNLKDIGGGNFYWYIKGGFMSPFVLIKVWKILYLN